MEPAFGVEKTAVPEKKAVGRGRREAVSWICLPFPMS
jgi:hypothetical protein